MMRGDKLAEVCFSEIESQTQRGELIIIDHREGSDSPWLHFDTVGFHSTERKYDRVGLWVFILQREMLLVELEVAWSAINHQRTQHLPWSTWYS